MWEPALSSPMSWNSMSCTTVPESQSSLESPECGRSAAEATSQTYKEQIIIFDRTPFDNFMYYIMREMEKKHFMYDRNKKNSILMEYGNIIEKEQNKFDLIFKVKRKYENTNESTTWVSINERKRVSALYKEQEYNFIPKYSEIYEIGSETFVDDVTVAAEKMAQKIYDYYYM